MAGDCIGSAMSYARNVHHAEFVAQGFLFKVTKPGISDFLEGSITEYFK